MKSYEIEPRDEMPGHAVDTHEVDTEEGTGQGYELGEGEGVISEGETPLEPQGPRFRPPSREQLLTWIPFWAVILLGAILRFWALGDKPLHHDESLHAYFSLHLLYDMSNWANCFSPLSNCYRYDPLLHGPFQFHFIALTYKISQLLGAPDNGVNTTTVRILAATLGSALVGLPYFLRDYLGKTGAWLACLLLAVSPSMVYFSRFAREDIYMAFFTLLLVVAMARYLRDRKMRWLVIAALAFALSYATKEATFLTVAVFGSFVGGLIIWELGLRIAWPLQFSLRDRDSATARFVPRTLAPFFVLIYVIVAAVVAKFFFHWLDDLAIYITMKAHVTQADAYVQGLKDNTVKVVPWLGILLGLFVLGILAREMFGKLPPPGRRGLARWVDPRQQRVLDTIVTMPWTHWFFAVLVAWTVFLVLFTVLFTNIKDGIGSGIWQGLYYWIQQINVARGGQPWYYYLMLIPLYEQIGLVFGLAGVVRCLLRPTRFRLFLVYWFVGNVVLYSWAAEKMPWLMIHMTMPMMLLAAIALEPVVLTLFNFAKERFTRPAVTPVLQPAVNGYEIPRPRPHVGGLRAGAATLGMLAALLLLIPTLNNMYQVTYVHPADGPHEMMVYVQTTPDVNTVMAKVDALDRLYFGGKHQMPIGIASDAVWPFVWYVRDYPNICLNYPTGCSASAQNFPVIIAGGDNPSGAESQYSTAYVYHQYHMRSWWDEAYKPPPCIASKANNNCAGQQQFGGVGPLLWLSYGDTPPPNAHFNPGLAAQRIWNWWWHRQPFGYTDGNYDMVLFIRKGMTGVTP